MNLWKAYLRWRHSKGYGVHSPYAYRFITDVLNPGSYGYYAYHNIKGPGSNSSWSPSALREIKFLIRLAVFLRAKRIVSYRNFSDLAEAAAKAIKSEYKEIGSNENHKFGKDDLLIIGDDKVSQGLLNDAIEAGAAIYTLNYRIDLKKAIGRDPEKGLLLRGTYRNLFIPRKEMEFVEYEIKF